MMFDESPVAKAGTERATTRDCPYIVCHMVAS
jgi:hypothetical protein